MKSTVSLVILVLLVLLSFLILRDLEKSLEVSEEAEISREIAVAYNVQGRYFGVDNRLSYRVDSESVSEYSQQKGTEIRKPKIKVLESSNDVSWLGNAQTALLSADRDAIVLEGNVTITQSPNTAKAIIATSERMIYYADERAVVGDAPVVIEQNGTKQQANHFKLNASQKNISFGGGVKAQFSTVQ